MTDETAPVAGWYPDPESPGGERWWSGSGWSDHRRTPGSVAVAAPAWQPAAAPEGAAPVYYAPVAPVNGFAVAGLATSLGSLLVPLLPAIIGAILSGIGLRRARERQAAGIPNTGRGLAVAGLICGIALGALQLAFVVFYLILLSWVFSTYPSGTF